MIRLRVSDIDSWIDYAYPQFEAVALSTEDFMARMERTSPKSPEMLAGSALHKLLEKAKAGDEWGDEGVLVDGVHLRFEVSHAFELPWEREPEITQLVFDTPYGKVLLRGRIDGREMDGTVVDYKLSGKFSAERYARSMQWKAYALMKEARRFKYLVFHAKGSYVYDDPNCFWEAWVHDVHELVLWSYPEMEAEVKEMVTELAEFVVKHVPALVVPDGEETQRRTQ